MLIDHVEVVQSVNAQQDNNQHKQNAIHDAVSEEATPGQASDCGQLDCDLARRFVEAAVHY